MCTVRCLNRGAAGSGRSDDNKESLQKRINVYLNETQPIIDYYKQLNLVHTIDSSRSKDEIFADVKKIFDDLSAMGDI